MASKTTSIPRYLLPQYGALWRTAARSTAFARPLDASRTATIKTAGARVTAIRAAHTKAGTSSKSPASKAAKYAPPTKPPPKHPAKATPAAAKTITPKTPTPPPTPEPAPKTDTTPDTPKPTPAPAPAPAPAPTLASKPAAAPKPAEPSKPLVLEKPERFNPPSHGARLPRSTPKHYGGGPTPEELQAQTAKAYPGLPPPPNTWTHWFINSRGIHLFITLGTLGSLAVYTFATNFAAKSPFADMIPPISELPRHPVQYLRVCIDVLRMHEEHESALAVEKRRRKAEDVTKRNEYRKAHGIEPVTGFFGGKAEPPAPVPAQTAEAEAGAAPTVEPSEHDTTTAAAATVAPESTPGEKRKKFLGIF
ncbi:hypothetical protein AAE478_005557 [Parahypoxylon ruwenzoriense]